MISTGGPGSSRPCRSCSAPVYDLRHITTGKLAPIEVGLSPGGNVAIDLEAGTYRVLSGLELAAARGAGSELRVNHFVSCPSAAAWHKRSGRA